MLKESCAKLERNVPNIFKLVNFEINYSRVRKFCKKTGNDNESSYFSKEFFFSNNVDRRRRFCAITPSYVSRRPRGALRCALRISRWTNLCAGAASAKPVTGVTYNMQRVSAM